MSVVQGLQRLSFREQDPLPYSLGPVQDSAAKERTNAYLIVINSSVLSCFLALCNLLPFYNYTWTHPLPVWCILFARKPKVDAIFVTVAR